MNNMTKMKIESRREAFGSQDRSAGRRGAVLIVALVCLMLISLILGSLLKLVVTHRRQMRGREHRLQAVWLAESGIQRAVHRLADGSGYGGEEWNIPAEEIGGRHAGRVKITVETSDADDERTVIVEAIYPYRETKFAKRTKQVTVQVPPKP